MTAPPFAYYGGKTSIAPKIVQLLPPHRHYVEPYGGGLSVLLATPRAAFETVNDLDQDLMTFWRVLRDRAPELARVCALTPHSRAEHNLAFVTDVADELERARRIWVRLSQGRGGIMRRTGWRFYRDAARRSGSMPWTLNAYVERMRDVVERIVGVSLECRPGVDLVIDYGRHESVLLYVDPPYLGVTRGPGNQYRHELRDENSHRELAAALHACAASVVLSGYASDLYDRDLYSDWCRVEIPSYSGNAGGGGRRGDRTEVLWSNRALLAEHLFAEAL